MGMKTKKKPRQVVSVRLDVMALIGIKVLARSRNMSVSRLVENLILKELKNGKVEK